MVEGSTPGRPAVIGDLHLSRIGLGTAALKTGESRFTEAIRQASELGINWIDTDAILDRGDIERRIGASLNTLPAGDRPFVSLAVGFDWDGRSRHAQLRPTFDPRRLRRQLERSLSRLGAETADLVKLHLPIASDALFEDAWSLLLDLRQKGLLRHLGLIAPDSSHLERAERIGACDTVHVEMSLFDRRVSDGELPVRRQRTPAVIANHAFGPDLAVLPNDREGSANTLQPMRLLLRTIAARRRASPAAVAAAWSLSWPGVAAVAVGIHTPDELPAIAKAAEITLSPRDFSDIGKLLPTLGSGRGPVHPRLAGTG
ncbi:aldo/keto reductase [Pleomorphomonas sp. JP5]|uniref:aldo/keto reductase n=1 Tax=Pleomorphomonas sp. JP5 TaxID=2942998 RepID=UPI002043EE72|nr:aldo/keto reductase [Pleomorphomonas sp. JP5]MCM5558829.1 aldo/keto reductase [Pleomorphomonas sp. JP5]